jgi:hypothetical protein
VQTSEPFTYQNFLAKFNTLQMFFCSPEVIQRVTREAVGDAAVQASFLPVTERGKLMENIRNELSI